MKVYEPATFNGWGSAECSNEFYRVGRESIASNVSEMEPASEVEVAHRVDNVVLGRDIQVGPVAPSAA